MTGDEIEELDRNARAYGWEIGRGQPIGPQIETTPDNPFLNPDWRAAAQGTSEPFSGKDRLSGLDPLHPLNPETP